MGPEIAILIVALVAWGAGWWLVVHLGVGHVPGPTATPGVGPTDGGDSRKGRWSIIIPARNEEANLPRLLRSLHDQDPAADEVLVMDDGSTDQTAAVARAHGAKVIAVPPLPEGWRGKSWACHHGAAVATGDVLLFLDADTYLQPGALARLRQMHTGGALSLGPYHEVRRAHEQLSAFFNLLMAIGTVPRGAFGQMLLIDRATYDCVGGHASVKEKTLENLHLASRLREHGVTSRSALGRGILAFRMYPEGLRQLVQGWVKGFASGAGRTPGPLLAMSILWLSGMVSAVIVLALAMAMHRAFWPVPVYAAFALQGAVMLRRVGRFAWYTSAFYPLPLVFFIVVFTLSGLRRGATVTWKGRSFRAD